MPDALRPGPPAGRVAKREERRRGRLLGVTPRAALGVIVATAAAVAITHKSWKSWNRNSLA
mgnify:CR=1 FL=1